MEMASFSLKIRHVFADTSLTERSIGAGPPVIIQLSGRTPRVFHSSSGAIQHGARSQNMTYFRLQFFIGPSITMLYPVLVYISASALFLFCGRRLAGSKVQQFSASGRISSGGIYNQGFSLIIFWPLIMH